MMLTVIHEDSRAWWDGESRRRFCFAQSVMICKRRGDRDAARGYWRTIWAIDKRRGHIATHREAFIAFCQRAHITAADAYRSPWEGQQLSI